MKTQEEYIEDSGECPRCGSDEIEGEEITIENGQAFQDVSCFQCGLRWQDQYLLNKFIILEDV